MKVCDEVSQDPEKLCGPARIAIVERLNQRDANVVLRALSLSVAVAQNCGSRMQQEIASRAFLEDCLIRKLSDRKVHKTIKNHIVALIDQLNKDFLLDPSLRPMADAYDKIKRDFPQLMAHSSQADGPNKPGKHRKTQSEQRDEDDELKRAMELSLQDYERTQTLRLTIPPSVPLGEHTGGISREQAPFGRPETAHYNPQSDLQEQAGEVKPAEQAVSSVSKVLALYDLISYEPDELSFRKGDVILVIESVYRDWWRGSLPSGQTGIFPLNYVTPMVSKTPQELAQEAMAESQILDRNLRTIDRLLTLLLSDFAKINEDEVTALYNQVVPLRPQLGKCIDKYNVRKEELAVLNGQLNSKLAQYNDSMDKLISLRGNRNMQAYNVGAPYPGSNIPELHQTSSENYPLDMQHTSYGFGNGPSSHTGNNSQLFQKHTFPTQ